MTLPPGKTKALCNPTLFSEKEVHESQLRQTLQLVCETNRGTHYVYYDNNSTQHLLQGMVFAEIGKNKSILAGLQTLSGNITNNYSHWNNSRDEE